VAASGAAQIACDRFVAVAAEDLLRWVISGIPESETTDPLLCRLFPPTVPFLWPADHF
jgi:hypothetical protein